MLKEMKKDSNIEVAIFENPGEFEFSENYETDTEKTALVKKIEALVRTSMEYSDYISFLRTNVGMDSCAFFNNVSKSNNKKIRIEVHHTPLTLFDITKLVLDKAIDEGEEINALLIAEKVTRIHYMNQVGLIPLSKTLHEVVHNSDKLVIPMYMIYGDYRTFLKEYEDQLEKKENQGIYKKIEDMLTRTKELNEHSFDVLQEKFTYIKVDGFEMPIKQGEVEVETKVDLETEAA
jgi:hypothetical protein